jgi:hypothetical protein
MALYNLQNETEVINFDDKCNYLKSKGKTADLIEKKNTRTTKQNSALHLLYSIMCNHLNELGLEYRYFGLKGQVLEMRYTTDIVKNFIWRPIQIALFDIESTTKINTSQINEILDVITKFYADKGVVIQFPSKESLKALIEGK